MAKAQEAAQTAATQTQATHFDILDDSLEPEEDYGTGIQLDYHFPDALDPYAWNKIVAEQRPVQTMVKRSYPEEEWRFVGYNGHPLLVKTDYMVTIPEGVALQLRNVNGLALTVARRIRKMQHDLMHPEDAPWAPGQGPKETE